MAERVWAFGGGKGGVGKSLVCAIVGAELARRGLRVVALDADLGAANLHTLLGLLQPARTLSDFVLGRAHTLDEVCLDTEVPGLRLISGAAGILRAAHPRPTEKERLIDAVLGLDVDVVLIDLGAGTHYTTLDFFNLAGLGLVVTGPEPTSIQNAYAFLKSALFRRIELGCGHEAVVRAALARVMQPRDATERLDAVGPLIEAVRAADPAIADAVAALVADFRAQVVINQANEREERRVLGALRLVCHRYLDVALPHAGTLPIELEVRTAIRRMKSVAHTVPYGALGDATAAMVDRLLEFSGAARPDLLLRRDLPPSLVADGDQPPADADSSEHVPHLPVADASDRGGDVPAEGPPNDVVDQGEPPGTPEGAWVEPPAPEASEECDDASSPGASDGGLDEGEPLLTPGDSLGDLPAAEMDDLGELPLPEMDELGPLSVVTGSIDRAAVAGAETADRMDAAELAWREGQAGPAHTEAAPADALQAWVGDPEETPIEVAVVPVTAVVPAESAPIAAVDRVGAALGDDPLAGAWDAAEPEAAISLDLPEEAAPPVDSAAPDLAAAWGEWEQVPGAGGFGAALDEAFDRAERPTAEVPTVDADEMAWDLPADAGRSPVEPTPSPPVSAAQPQPLVDPRAVADIVAALEAAALPDGIPAWPATSARPHPGRQALAALTGGDSDPAPDWPDDAPVRRAAAPGFTPEDSLPDFDPSSLGFETPPVAGARATATPHTPPPPATRTVDEDVEQAFDDIFFEEPASTPTPAPGPAPAPAPTPARSAAPPGGQVASIAGQALAVGGRDADRADPQDEDEGEDDYDPWADAELASSAGRPRLGAAPSLREEAPASWAPLDDGVAHGRRAGDPLPDPPAHRSVGLDEPVVTPDGTLHVQTMDLAPAQALIRQSVFASERLVHRVDHPYEDLLDAEGVALDPERVPARVEALHRQAVSATRRAGVAGLSTGSAR